MHLAALLLLALALPVSADVVVPVCHGYGCIVQDEIRFSESQLARVTRQMASAVNAENERKLLGEAIGQLYAWGGEQSDIRNDRGGNYADAGIPGRMDCIDHSISTTRLLELLAARGALRWHRVLTPEVRHFLWIFPAHWSAVIEALAAEDSAPQRFVVDSWFVNNGEPAVILPLADWKKGAGPDV
jgi:hypothetical protein